MSLATVLEGIAPTIATALGGPLAGAAVSFLANKLGVDPAIVEQTVAGMSGDDLVKMKQIDSDFQIEMGKQGIAIQLAQIKVNEVEATSTNWFVAGWRPFIGWVCGLGLAYQFLFMPIMNGLLKAAGTISPFISLDTGTLMSCVAGLLGLGTLRTYEKKTGSESNR